jgi:transposase
MKDSTRIRCRKAGIPTSATNQTNPGTVAVLDNIQFHHSKETMNAFSIMGIRPLFVPPYSPEFNFIENVFSLLKQRIAWSTRLAVESSPGIKIFPTLAATSFSLQ